MKVIRYETSSELIQELLLKDPLLKPLFIRNKTIEFQTTPSYFKALVEAILAQQLSTLVAKVITKRFYLCVGDACDPYSILSITPDAFKTMGLSKQKISYLKSLAEFYLANRERFEKMEEMSDQAVIDFLTQVKGIGPWTAEMFLIFSLGREDVFSLGDLGLRNAVKRLYNNPDLTASDLISISQKWSPYRSVVSHFLWHAWDEIE